MPRVTPMDVTDIRPTTRAVLPYILTATVVVDRLVETVTLPTLVQFEVERWLSAHLMEVADPRMSKTDLGDTSVSYAQGKLGTGLDATVYGQQVLALCPEMARATTTGVKRASILVD